MCKPFQSRRAAPRGVFVATVDHSAVGARSGGRMDGLYLEGMYKSIANGKRHVVKSKKCTISRRKGLICVFRLLALVLWRVVVSWAVGRKGPPRNGPGEGGVQCVCFPFCPPDTSPRFVAPCGTCTGYPLLPNDEAKQALVFVLWVGKKKRAHWQVEATRVNSTE